MKKMMPFVLALALGACSGEGPTGPDPVVNQPEAPIVALPSRLYGAFVRSDDVLEAAANGGSVVLVVPSYADDAGAVAAALRGNGKVAILSTHHVFSGAEVTWDQGWARTKEWAKPFEDRIAAIYVLDEPLHNRIGPVVRDRAIARVRQDGFRTMIGEWVDEASRNNRPAVDLYGVTCYDWPGQGSWTLARCQEAYRTHPEWDVAIGQGFDWHSRSGTPAQQIAAWAEIGRARRGVIFWVWDWPGQVGIRVDRAALAAYREEAQR